MDYQRADTLITGGLVVSGRGISRQDVLVRGETIQEIDRAVRTALEVGLEVSLFFIVGLPGETTQTFQEALDFALKYPITTATYYNLIPFPGTELFDWVKHNKYFIIQPKDYLNTIAQLEFVPVFQTPEFSAQERKVALEMGRMVNIQTKRRDMERKLGNSLISRALSWLVYGSCINMVIFAALRVKWIKQAINFVLLKLRIRFNL